FAVRYPPSPVVQPPPRPLKAANVFAVAPDGKVTLLTDARGLEKFLQARLVPVKDVASAREATGAWLRLSQEFSQDGTVQFAVPRYTGEITVKEQVKGRLVATVSISARVTVEARDGGQGEISVFLQFRSGKLLKATERRNVKAGARPGAGAARLPDRAPVVCGPGDAGRPRPSRPPAPAAA